MAEISYVSKSISNIGKDTKVSEVGTVIVNTDGSVELQDNSKCTFSYDYTTDDKLMCEKLKVDFSVETSSNVRTTRYNASITVDVIVHYFEESFSENGVSQGYIDGAYQFTRLIPAFTRESNGYIGSLIIDNESGLYIKKIDLSLSFYSVDGIVSGDTVKFNYVRIFNSRTTEQVVTDTYGWSAVVSHIQVKPNGYALKYDGTSETTTLLIDIEDIEGTPTLTQIIVNSTKDSEKIIIVSSDTTPIPRSS